MVAAGCNRPPFETGNTLRLRYSCKQKSGGEGYRRQSWWHLIKDSAPLTSGFYRNFIVTPVTIWCCALINTKLTRQLQEFLGTEQGACTVSACLTRTQCIKTRTYIRGSIRLGGGSRSRSVLIGRTKSSAIRSALLARGRYVWVSHTIRVSVQGICGMRCLHCGASDVFLCFMYENRAFHWH